MVGIDGYSYEGNKSTVILKLAEEVQKNILENGYNFTTLTEIENAIGEHKQLLNDYINFIQDDKINDLTVDAEVEATQEIKENNKNMEVEKMDNNIYIGYDEENVDYITGTMQELTKLNLKEIQLLSDVDIESCIDDIKKLCKNKNNIEIIVEGTEISIYLNNKVYARWSFTTENINDDILLQLYMNIAQLGIKVKFLNNEFLEVAATQENKNNNIEVITDFSNIEDTDTLNMIKEIQNKGKNIYKITNEYILFGDPKKCYVLRYFEECQGHNKYINLNKRGHKGRISKDINKLLKVIQDRDIKEEFYNNEVVAAPEEPIILGSNDIENNSNINMSLQLLASSKKELRPIFNTDIKGHEEYQKENLNLYNSNSLAFEKKRITNKMIEEYTKYFIYKDNRFMSVKPCKNIPYGYIEHVKNNRTLTVDTKNKIILCVEN